MQPTIVQNKAMKTIDIIAKEWFDRINGNSYFSALVTTDYGTKDARTFTIPFQYGYGDHYKHIAMETLKDAGVINPETKGALWRYCQDNGIILRATKHENCLKRDVKAYTE